LIFVALVLVEVANPGTRGILKIAGGFRQHLEWIPFFFFGYVVMRSKERFRKFFLILGVIALANGVVSTIQTQLTPAQLASWGPGYSELINGTGNVSGRTYRDSEGVSRVRPMALGSDLGYGGFVGVLALPGILALFATGRLRRRWVAALLCLGALLAIATSLQRTAVLGAVFALLAFALFSFSAGRRVTRVLAAVVVVVALTFALGSVLTADIGKGVFSRYTSIAPGKAASTSVNYREKTLAEIPTDIAAAPFGAGLATVGAAAYFGGTNRPIIEGLGASGESQYNFVTLELGLPGLLLWIALSIKLFVLGARRLRHIADLELRISLVAVFAALFAMAMMGFAGSTMSRQPGGPYFWFAAGIFAYWFAGPGRTTDQTTL
jgi:O-antigen ligase